MNERDRQPSPLPGGHHFALPPGTRLMEFQIESVLGHGGFGITYRALDTVLREVVAIKEYFPNELAGRVSTATVRAKSDADREDFEAGLDAFIEEARLITRFRHPNIVHVRRFFELHETGYIVLDYERGETLSKRIAAGPMSETELRSILAGLLDGLEAVHQHAILHRDLKPSNVILRTDGTPVLIDFGAARDFRERHSRSITAIAAPGYSPPEQYGVGGQQGPWTDIYALGAIAYRCVTGTVPPDSLRRLRNDPLTPAVKAAAGKYSPPLLRTIDWMLALDEAKRPAAVAEVRAALGGGRTRKSSSSVARLATIAASLIAVLALGGFGTVYHAPLADFSCERFGVLCAGPVQAVATPAVATAAPASPSPNASAAPTTPQQSVASPSPAPTTPTDVAAEKPKETPAPAQVVAAAPSSPSIAIPKSDSPADPSRRLAADEVAWTILQDGADADQLRRFVAQFPASPHRAEATGLLAKAAP